MAFILEHRERDLWAASVPSGSHEVRAVIFHVRNPIPIGIAGRWAPLYIHTSCRLGTGIVDIWYAIPVGVLSKICRRAAPVCGKTCFVWAAVIGIGEPVPIPISSRSASAAGRTAGGVRARVRGIRGAVAIPVIGCDGRTAAALTASVGVRTFIQEIRKLIAVSIQ